MNIDDSASSSAAAAAAAVSVTVHFSLFPHTRRSDAITSMIGGSSGPEGVVKAVNLPHSNRIHIHSVVN